MSSCYSQYLRVPGFLSPGATGKSISAHRGRLQVPGGSHRLVDQAVGLFVVDEELFVRVEAQRALEPYGDLGEVDEFGHYKITGRAKDMVIVGGFNVFPRIIEEHIIQHPKVQEVSATGVSDPDLGEVVAAAVIPEYRRHTKFRLNQRSVQLQRKHRRTC